MKVRLIAALLLVIAFTVVPAFAQTKAIDPVKLENIRHLLKATKGEDVQDAMVNQVLVALKPMFSASGNDARSRQLFGRFSDLVVEEFRKIDFMGITVSLYDKYFTNEEIVGLIRFYETPLGQKATSVLPTLVQESMARGQEQGQQAAERAINRLAQEFPELRSVLQGSGR
jgi:hypothetical protein